MYRFITQPLPYRALFTIALWLIAALIMSACSTAVQSVSPPDLTQKNIKKEAIAPPEPPKKSASLSSSVAQKKQQFFNFMKPIVMAENEKIRVQRQNIIRLKEKTILNSDEQAQLRHLTRQYQLPVSIQPGSGLWQAMLNRVDIIPLDLALAQAANESAWGKSRFAREGNNYFGQWCFRKGCGIVPRQRKNNATHEVRRFNNAVESVHAYMKNINTSAAYRDLRKQRSLLRQHQKTIHAELLANELKHYSQRGMAYVKSIQSMIRNNRTLVAQATALPVRVD